MHAILEIAGKQFKVIENRYLYTPKLESKNNGEIEFDKVLLFKDKEGKIEIGSPVVKGIKVTGKVLETFKDKKVIVFKKKRRKGYKKSQGHRQSISKVLIEKITKE
ncbi:MAG: 50S ribosomal protein L21 [Bacteroidetes bacterium]|nr:50S ribosomal protein L21 [Bacteroidota bacterium]